MKHVQASGRIKDLQAAELGSVAAVQVSGGLEDDLWLVPIEDQRGRGAVREGMRTGFTLGQYLMLVEYTGRILRDGKAANSSEVADIFALLGITPETWGVRMAKLTGVGALVFTVGAMFGSNGEAVFACNGGAVSLDSQGCKPLVIWD